MSDVKYTSRSFDAFPSQQFPTSPPPPPPEHRYLTPLPPSINSPSINDSYDTESPASTNNAPDSRSTSILTQQQQPNDHHYGNAPAAEEIASGVNSSPSLPRAFSLSSLIRDEEQPEDPEHSQVISISTSNPSHLFWVPAAQHPELAPNEFEKFLQTNSHAKRERASIRRRSSILSVSFTASDAQKQEEDDEGRMEGDSRKYTLEALERGKQQQQPFEYNEQHHHDQQQQHNSSHQGDDEGLPRKTRLRRSISLDMATAAENQMRVPDFLVFDRNSSPLDQSRVLVPRADRPSLLRRGARTKFQRNSSFTPPSARQVDRHRQAESMPPGAYTERLDHSTLGGGITLSDSSLVESPLDLSLSIAQPSPPPPTQSSPSNVAFAARPMERRASAEEIPRLQSSPTPSIVHEVQGLEIGQNVVTQEHAPLEHQTHEQHQQYQQHHQLNVPARASSERKSSWSWGFKRSKSEQVRSDVNLDKAHLHAETVPRPRPSVSTDSPSNTSGSAATPQSAGTGAPINSSIGGKDSSSNNSSGSSSGKRSFGLSSLFSRKSSSNKAQATTPAAQNTVPMPPKDFQLNRINQNRLPIHIERAIYRLSHSKLANPRRPLHQQVIISNLMFAYLALVSASQQAHQQNPSNGTTPDNRARKFVNAGKKGKRRPSSNSSSPRPPSPQQQQQQQQQQQLSQQHPQQQQHSQHGRPPSPSNGSYQQKARSSTKQEDNGNGVLHQFMGTSRDSTGFVVPENYLKPRQQGSKGMAGVGRRSSLSDSDEDDDDDDALSDSSSDEEPSNSSVTMKARAAAATKHRASNDIISNHTRIAKQRGDDDVPLALYRKGKV